MTRSLSSPKFQILMSATLQNTLADGAVASAATDLRIQDTLTNGVDSRQANRTLQIVHSAGSPRTITAGASHFIDLYSFDDDNKIDVGAGVGRDGVGLVLTLEEIVSIVIKNENDIDSAGVLEVQPASTNGWTPIGVHTGDAGLEGQSALAKHAPGENGFDIEDGVSHRLRLNAVGADVNYSIWILGRSDDEASSSSSSNSSSSSQSSSASSESSSISSESSSLNSESSISTSSSQSESSSISSQSDESSSDSSSSRSESSSISSESSQSSLQS